MKRQVKVAILREFDSQSDFAQELQVSESIISRVVRGRKKISKNEAIRWATVLKCDPGLLDPVVDRDK